MGIFMFLVFKNHFVGSFHSKPLHGLDVISFMTLPGNKYCHGNTFFVSWAYINKHFCGFFAFQTLAWVGADKFFSDTWHPILLWQHFCFLDLLIFYGFILYPSTLHGLELIRFLAKPGIKCCHGSPFPLSWVYI